jgi:hypothetical protein
VKLENLKKGYPEDKTQHNRHSEGDALDCAVRAASMPKGKIGKSAGGDVKGTENDDEKSPS